MSAMWIYVLLLIVFFLGMFSGSKFPSTTQGIFSWIAAALVGIYSAFQALF